MKKSLTSEWLRFGTVPLLSGRAVWNHHVVPSLLTQFSGQCSSYGQFTSFVEEKGGKGVLDHFGTRTVEPEVHSLLTRIGRSMELSPQNNYEFPDKNLTAIDLQLPHQEDGAKWFSTLGHYKRLSPVAIAAIEEDITRTRNRPSERAMELLEKLESDGYLREKEADEFAKELVPFFGRQGKPIKHTTLNIVANESQEMANALLLGPAPNHFALSLNRCEVAGWTGIDDIETVTKEMKKNRFPMIPSIQGIEGGVLRQTSTLADKSAFPVELPDGAITTLSYPGRFTEIVARGLERSPEGHPLFLVGGCKIPTPMLNGQGKGAPSSRHTVRGGITLVVAPSGNVEGFYGSEGESLEWQSLEFQGFLRDNASKIYESTGIVSRERIEQRWSDRPENQQKKGLMAYQQKPSRVIAL